MQMILSPLRKTWIFDFDGTLVEHNGYKTGRDRLLPGVRDFLSKIPEDDCIIILTARECGAAEKTERFLKEEGIRYNHIFYEIPMGERLLFNDSKPSGLKMCYSIERVRNQGLSDVEFLIDQNL